MRVFYFVLGLLFSYDKVLSKKRLNSSPDDLRVTVLDKSLSFKFDPGKTVVTKFSNGPGRHACVKKSRLT